VSALISRERGVGWRRSGVGGSCIGDGRTDASDAGVIGRAVRRSFACTSAELAVTWDGESRGHDESGHR